MNLHDRYLEAIKEHGFSTDQAQLAAIATLDRVREQLIRRASTPCFIARLMPQFMQPWFGAGLSAPVRGAYLWGGVGRGKTFVMDLFFDSLPFEQKLRRHFHRMMYRVHGQLQRLGNHKDPLERVADELAGRARVICFDEFFVADIADAMLLGRLLDALFRRGVTLVATSNIAPDELYHDGLQRAQFLPAIALLNEHTEVLNVDGPTDYRLRVLEQAELYHAPLDAAATRNLADYFERIAPDAGTRGQAMEVLGRNIPMIRRADGLAWFDFGALCDGPRSQNDYIEIARSFQTVIVSDVPLLDRPREDQARRFIALVDEFYDRKVKLIISATAPIAGLYTGDRLTQEFERTRSRLLEMQSTAYLAAPHVP
ncbi:MAG: cell division protein ZapE [Gammaproteobacteria bacterium]|nr:MAG: cell division protein ZapE [Gammaproteobacteria bacterium]